MLCLLYSGGVAAQVEISDQARKQFRIGIALLRDQAGPRYEEAYRAFKAAYADSPSPKILGNIGLCAMKLERDGEAIDAYEEYLAKAPGIEPDEREQIEGDLEVMRGTAVTLRLQVRPADVVLVDERIQVKGAHVVNRWTPTVIDPAAASMDPAVTALWGNAGESLLGVTSHAVFGMALHGDRP